jgi:hypothetical protein
MKKLKALSVIIIATTITGSAQANLSATPDGVENGKVCHIESASSASKTCQDGDVMLFILI